MPMAATLRRSEGKAGLPSFCVSAEKKDWPSYFLIALLKICLYWSKVYFVAIVTSSWVSGPSAVGRRAPSRVVLKRLRETDESENSCQQKAPTGKRTNDMTAFGACQRLQDRGGGSISNARRPLSV